MVGNSMNTWIDCVLIATKVARPIPYDRSINCQISSTGFGGYNVTFSAISPTFVIPTPTTYLVGFVVSSLPATLQQALTSLVAGNSPISPAHGTRLAWAAWCDLMANGGS